MIRDALKTKNHKVNIFFVIDIDSFRDEKRAYLKQKSHETIKK